jgi:hypothetical protein
VERARDRFSSSQRGQEEQGERPETRWVAPHAVRAVWTQLSLLTLITCFSDASRGSVAIDLERGDVSRNVIRGDGQVREDGRVRRRSISIAPHPGEFRSVHIDISIACREFLD